MTRSVKSRVGPVSARPGKSAAKARSRKSGGPVPAISAWENGKSSIVSTRPASESGEIEPRKRSTEPVIRKRPGRGSSSTTCLRARMRLGARWISSITAAGWARMKPTGSLRANRLNCWSSRVMKGRPSAAAMRRARVVLPDWRGPTMATMRVSSSAARTRRSACRATNSPRRIVRSGISYRPIRNEVPSDSEFRSESRPPSQTRAARPTGLNFPGGLWRSWRRR